jgi:hypothetical protein
MYKSHKADANAGYKLKGELAFFGEFCQLQVFETGKTTKRQISLHQDLLHFIFSKIEQPI